MADKKWYETVEGLSQMALPVTIERGKPAPLDKYSLFDTYEDALKFISEHSSAFVGAFIYVLNQSLSEGGELIGQAGAYIVSGIGENASLTKIANTSEVGGNIADIQSQVNSLTNSVSSLSNALHFLGVSTTDPLTGSLTIGGNVYNKELKAGDIVIFGTKEFVYDGSNWEELGDVTGVSELLTWNEVTPAPIPEPGDDEGGEEA